MSIKDEIKTRLRYALPYYESEDKERYIYLVEEEDLDRAVKSLTLLFKEKLIK